MISYSELMIWKNTGEGAAIRYRCLQNNSNRKYCVQNVDIFRLPIDKSQIVEAERMFVELLADVAPIERCEWFSSVEEAVAAHDAEF